MTLTQWGQRKGIIILEHGSHSSNIKVSNPTNLWLFISLDLDYTRSGPLETNITLFRSTTMFGGTDNIAHNILGGFHNQYEYAKYIEIFCGILSVPQNIVMDLNNVMKSGVEWSKIDSLQTTHYCKALVLDEWEVRSCTMIPSIQLTFFLLWYKQVMTVLMQRHIDMQVLLNCYIRVFQCYCVFGWNCTI